MGQSVLCTVDDVGVLRDLLSQVTTDALFCA